MKKILLLHAEHPHHSDSPWSVFQNMLREKMKDVRVESSALSRLTFILDGSATCITDEENGYDVADFDLIVFRIVGKRREEAVAVAAYCRKKGIPYIDQYISTVGNYKLDCAFIRYEHDLPVPKTIYGPNASKHTDIIKLPAIVKSNSGRKGRDNFLVKTNQELERILKDHSDFVVQQYIPSDGDYRILVMNNQPVMAMKRYAAPESHLSNTSQGGRAEHIPLEAISKAVLDLAVKATKVDRLTIAGVDIIVDTKSNQPYILEVNRAPQLSTGAFVDEKMQAYSDALRNIVKKEKNV